MPTYTYRCTKCGEEIEAVQSMSDPPLKRCRTCRGKLIRTFHPVGIVLKGSGFYKTDNRSKSGGSSGEKKATSEGSKESKKDDSGSKKDDSSSKSEKSGSGDGGS